MRLEPLEFKQCLVSLGYNLKEGDKVGHFHGSGVISEKRIR